MTENLKINDEKTGIHMESMLHEELRLRRRIKKLAVRNDELVVENTELTKETIQLKKMNRRASCDISTKTMQIEIEASRP